MIACNYIILILFVDFIAKIGREDFLNRQLGMKVKITKFCELDNFNNPKTKIQYTPLPVR
jgi:hypothetical protein